MDVVVKIMIGALIVLQVINIILLAYGLYLDAARVKYPDRFFYDKWKVYHPDKTTRDFSWWLDDALEKEKRLQQVSILNQSKKGVADGYTKHNNDRRGTVPGDHE